MSPVRHSLASGLIEPAAGLSVAAAMICSVIVMLIVAISRFVLFEPGGKVIPGLIIAVLGLITNLGNVRRLVHRLRGHSRTTSWLPVRKDND
jgi:Co/Zn/Cd efflux system component